MSTDRFFAVPLFQRPNWLWLLNLATLAALVGWVLIDARGGASWFSLLNSDLPLQTLTRRDGSLSLLLALLGVGCAGLAVAWLTILCGPTQYRRLIAWLATTGLTCLWLGLAINMPQLIWQGHRMRLQAALPNYELATRSLRTAWPVADGEDGVLGPFSAYPIAQPKTLLLLSRPQFASGTRVTAIERTDAGGIRLELAGKERGVWLEWHPDGHSPESFVGGLEDSHKLEKFSPLGNCWYVARYK